jgi:hypothetical protein
VFCVCKQREECLRSFMGTNFMSSGTVSFLYLFYLSIYIYIYVCVCVCVCVLVFVPTAVNNGYYLLHGAESFLRI